MDRTLRGSGLQEFLQKNEKSGARASGGAGVSCECRVGGMCRGELRILLTSIFGANKPYFLAGGHYVFVSRE